MQRLGQMESLFKELINKYWRNFAVYFVAGLLCALINWASFYILYYKLLMHYAIAAFIAFVIASTVNFYLSRAVFDSRGRTKRAEFILIMITSAIGLGIDLGVMYVVINFFMAPAMLAKIAGTGVAFIFNYLVRQFFIFSPNKH